MNIVENGHAYIATAGNIGVGKSTAGKVIAEGLGFAFFPEPPFENNKFIGIPGKEFDAETYFLREKIALLILAQKEKVQRGVVVDVPLEQDLHDYAKRKLDPPSFELLIRMRDALEDAHGEALIVPSLIVYLEASESVNLERIRSRRRDFEQGITASDLRLQDGRNHDWIEELRLPAMFINTDRLDIVNSNRARYHLVSLVRKRLNSHYR